MLTSSSDQRISEHILRAQRRLVYISPGVNETIAKAILAARERLSPDLIQVILDADPEAMRLGYGTMAGMSLLFGASQNGQLILNRMMGLRLGVIIADDATLVFSPIPLAIEAPNEERLKPNAMILGPQEATDPDQMVADNKQVGTMRLTKEEFDRIQDNLKTNPATQYDISRRMRVFNAKFDFVELSVTGCEVTRRTLRLPPELLGFAKSNLSKRVKGQMLLLGDDDSSKAFDNSAILKLRKEIEKSYFITVPTYGNLIRKELRPAFEAKVKELDALIDKLYDEIQSGLKNHLESMRAQLSGILLAAAKRDLPVSWAKTMGLNPSDDMIAQRLDQELNDSFEKGKNDLLKSMQVQVVFKGVTYELLTNEDFLNRLRSTREGLDVINSLHEEWNAAPEREKAH